MLYVQNPTCHHATQNHAKHYHNHAKVDHIAIVVSDIARSSAFYGSKLGMLQVILKIFYILYDFFYCSKLGMLQVILDTSKILKHWFETFDMTQLAGCAPR